jgi:hypothetical protein
MGSGGVLIAALAVTNYLLTAAPAPLVVVKDFWGAIEYHHDESFATRSTRWKGKVASTAYERLQFAYAHFNSDLQREQSLQEFQELATSHSSFFRAGARFWSMNVEDGTATVVEGRFTIDGDVEVASALFRLVKTNGTWKIAAYRIQDDQGGFAGGTIP